MVMSHLLRFPKMRATTPPAHGPIWALTIWATIGLWAL